MDSIAIDKIRNFSIIAHIDHGKSTLADRLLEFTKTIDKRQMRDQVLDTMDLERERGITIKAQAIRLEYKAKDKQTYALNLIDTPGHVDFSYEVSRALAACEGVLLIVDASQGIEAQTLAHMHQALKHDLVIIPVINKIDLPNAEPDMVAEELVNLFKINKEDIIFASAKEGKGIEAILEAIVSKVPPPVGDKSAPLQALIFDSHFNPYRGVIVYARIVNGSVKAGDKILLMGTQSEHEVLEVGTLKIELKPKQNLFAGEVGYLVAGIKEIKDAHVGDTITLSDKTADTPLPGYQKAKPMVYCGFYPVAGEDYELLKDALSKLQLNDAALIYEPENSAALGFGFRCGFLGLLHLEIVQERLEREFNLTLIATTPNVDYKLVFTNHTEKFIDNPTQWPSQQEIAHIEEPYMKITILTPSQYVGNIMEIANDKRGTFVHMEYLDPKRVMLVYEIPLAEVIIEFHDLIKSASRGYASYDYELIGYKQSELVKIDVLLNQEPVDALSFIVHKDKAYYKGRDLTKKLKEVIPRQMFEIPVQAAIGSKVIARETIPAIRKDVLAKCYGGDITRKRKLLEKQKEGKKRMKRVGSVDIPQEAFLALLKVDK